MFPPTVSQTVGDVRGGSLKGLGDLARIFRFTYLMELNIVHHDIE